MRAASSDSSRHELGNIICIAAEDRAADDREMRGRIAQHIDRDPDEPILTFPTRNSSDHRNDWQIVSRQTERRSGRSTFGQLAEQRGLDRSVDRRRARQP